MTIQYISYKEIDKQKWDACIDRSQNSLIYARSFYLDNMADNWDGLIFNDYEAVMPLTWKRKLGIKYLYQPAFIQQGGVFSKSAITEHMTLMFLQKAMEHFKFAEITLNHANPLLINVHIKTVLRTNFILDLNRPYTSIYNDYEDGFTKSLRRIKKFNLEYNETTDYEDIIRLYQHLYQDRLPYFSKKDFSRFEKICGILSGENNLICRVAYNENKTIHATVALIKDGNRLYNMISCITPEGKKLEANYFLYDKLIEELAGRAMILDLEGSDVKGIADFYKKLHPVDQPYPFIRFNNLHPVIKAFKP